MTINILVKAEYLEQIVIRQLSHNLTNEVLVLRREAKVRLLHIYICLITKRNILIKQIIDVCL